MIDETRLSMKKARAAQCMRLKFSRESAVMAIWARMVAWYGVRLWVGFRESRVSYAYSYSYDAALLLD